MKIGIFGDSFASLKNNTTMTWVEILSTKYEITNYAESGSTLMFSYENFLNHSRKYDINIFVVTSTGRLQLQTPIDTDHDYRKFWNNIGGLPRIERVLSDLRKNKDNWDNKVISKWNDIYLTASNYLKYFYNFKHEQLLSKLIVNDIINYKNSIVIPAYNYIHSLIDISKLENLAWDIKSATSVDVYYNDKRNCHMTYTNNKILSDLVLDHINASVFGIMNIDLNKFVKPNKEEKEFYLKLLE